MTDLFLKFPSRQTAIDVGVALGYTTVDPESGEAFTTSATLSLAVHVIGELMLPTGETATGAFGEPVPVLQGDGNWWIMVRILDQTPIPPEVQQYVVWPDDNDPLQPKNRWLDAVS